MTTKLLGKIGKAISTSILSLGVALVPLMAPIQARAAAVNITPQAKVSFTFDDGLTSAITQAAPTLAKYGFTGTNYAITNCIGMTVAPNTCRANDATTYMSWAQILALQNTYGWEIGSHTVSHPYLATSDATDGQPNVLTPAQVTAELVNSRAAFSAQGINTTDFAAPYGDYNPTVLAEIAKYYGSMRGFADTGYNIWPNSDYLIRDQQVQAGVTVAQVKAYVDSAIANNQWLVLTFHDIKTVASTNPDDYQYNTADLDAIAAYVKSKNVQVVNVSNGLIKSDTNLLPKDSFNNGIANGWTTDSPANITTDSLNNGSYPDPTSSIKLVASTKAQYLFSPKINVDFSSTYMLKNYLNVQKLTSGEVSFYIDEYDINGNWISGQYKKGARSIFVDEINFNYKPSSVSVSKASLQVGVSANSGITAYYDNPEWFPLVAGPAPVPTAANLLANGNFDSGITGGWTTRSPTSITADSLGNGSPSNPVNSIKATAAATNTYLFSPQVAVSSTTAYNVSAYVNTKQIASGEVGFYIDEYDANGNWISGQYKTGARAVSAGNVGFSYTPTSQNVKKASLQIIIVANSDIITYIDDVRFN